MGGLLAGTGIEHSIANSGEEAKQLISKNHFDFICVSMYLDDIDGIAFAQEVRRIKSYEHIPIVLFTTENSQDILKKAIFSGITDIFSKDKIDDLINFISRVGKMNGKRGGRVLYVEDSVSQRKLVVAYLEEHGLTVDEFSRGDEAWIAFQENEYDLLITDIMLDGDISGVMLVNQVRRLADRKGDTPILAVTGFDNVSRRIGLLHLGVNDYVTKPVVKDELLARVSNLLEIRDNQIDMDTARIKAEHQVLEKSSFLSNMSHEIRTPLNAILGLSRIGEISDTVNQQELFGRIKDSGQHLLTLVNDILDFSKFEADKIVLEEEPVKVSHLIDSSISYTSANAYKKGIEYIVHEEPGIPAVIRGDETRLVQILINLLGNAVKFTEAGNVTLHVAIKSNQLAFRISDTGIGMSPEQMGNLFVAFEQADSSTTRRFGGTGLGLAITKRLVESMDGEIIVESEIDKGSSFEILLPVQTIITGEKLGKTCAQLRVAGMSDTEKQIINAQCASNDIAIEHIQPEELLATSNEDGGVITAECLDDNMLMTTSIEMLNKGLDLRVLCNPELAYDLPDELRTKASIVERPIRLRTLLGKNFRRKIELADNEAGRLSGVVVLAADDIEVNRIVLEDILVREGAQVDLVENGQLAVDKVSPDSAAYYDIVLMDVQMPVMDGYVATRKIHDKAPDLPVLGLTAHAMTEAHDVCLKAGMSDRITKPIDNDTLVEAILKYRRKK